MSKIPKHIAIIMDGNGRWAKKKSFVRIDGHRAGVKTVRDITEYCREIGVKVLTLYAFSVENWKRPKREVNLLMKLLEEFLYKELDNLKKNQIKLMVIGKWRELPAGVVKSIKHVMHETKDCEKMILNLALNYGGRTEILDATKKIVEDSKSGKLVGQIDEEMFRSYLYTNGLPDPDLLIRTSGEYRVSNFLLWQISYSEIWVTDVLWPDFKRKHLEKALDDYAKRNRRFGGI